jgi:glycosyltransferase involved in cell wall biosynthesis
VIAQGIRRASGADLRVTMVGSGQDRPEAERLLTGDQRVEWIDWVEADELPAVVAAHDVCLGVFDTGPKAQRVVPNKVYQGAAAGCVVVTSDTAPQRRAFGDAALYVPAGDHRELGRVLADLAADRGEVSRRRRAAADAAAARFAPAMVVVPLLDALPGAGARVPSSGARKP